MNISAITTFRANLAAGRPVLGLWVTLESPSITEIAVTLGLDWVVVDAEHGHLDWKEIVEHVRAAVRSSTVILVRITELNGGSIKRALDLGADGVIVPWVESAEQLRQAVSYAQYPPEGVRGIGAERATLWGQAFVEHTTEANQNVLVIPIIETVRAARQLPAMLHVSGVDTYFFGPADFSASAGYRGQWEGPGVAEEILQLKDKIRSAGKSCGVMATSLQNLHQRRDQGFQMVGVGTDVGMLIRGIRETLQSVHRDCVPRADFRPGAPTKPLPLTRPPESFRPDRNEVMTKLGEGEEIELAPGVHFECQVGSHIQAKRLTTGYVRFAPGARLPYHYHEFTEAVTQVNGSITVEVEGRQYRLQRLDNVVIPPRIAHAATNHTRQESVLHVAVPTETLSRVLVDTFFSRRTMPGDSAGVTGKERVTRTSSVPRSLAGPSAEFVDYFNADLCPGIEMSGGYGLFLPGGRLPAHFHDFDESIAIISGAANCIVEGRKYEMRSGGTALQPRGRVHYFINESNSTMEMIWVYAGPRPERIVVDESCATEVGNPWR
jgi:2-keto-3-deoxy-L-rhamnonate aldolase RhmA/quercetin dioxygenase-like cupin family protein